jgi:transposase-like protein
MNLVKLIEEFQSEDACREFLARLRWREGVKCLRCQGTSISRIAKRNVYECNACRYQFSVRAGTIFGDSHLPLWKWFMAAYLMCEAKKGISALQLGRTINVSQKTAWYLCQRIRFAMMETNLTPLTGVVEADETWIGGVKRGGADAQARAKGRLSNKTMVLGAVERGGKIRLRVAANNRKGSVRAFLDDVVADDVAAIYTDELRSYDWVGDENTVHESVNHRREEWVRGDVHTNTVESAWSLFKRSVIGSYHHLSAKHLDAYLDEFEWRFNNRANVFLFRDTMLKLIDADTLRYKELIA